MKIKILAQKVFFVLPLFYTFLLQSTYACEVGTVIKSTAEATYTINDNEYNTISNTVEVIKTGKKAKSKIEFFKYYEKSNTSIKLGKTYYLNNDQLTLIKPLTSSNIAIPVAITSDFSTNESIMIMLTDERSNKDNKKIDSIDIKIENSGCDKEIIRVTENYPDSGQFVGYIDITLKESKRNIVDGKIFVDNDTDIKITQLTNSSKNRSLQEGISKTIKVSKQITLEEFETLASKKVWITNSANQNSVSIGEHIKCNIKIENKNNLDNLEVNLQLPKGITIQKNSFSEQGIKIQTANNGIVKFKIDKKLEFSYLLQVGIIKNKQILLNSWVEKDDNIISNFSNIVISVKEDLDRTKSTIFGEITGVDKQYLKGIKLYLENGMSTLTDINGKYHFENIKAGTHIIQIDTDTLDGEIDNISQFIDLKIGGIKRVDFRIFKKKKEKRKKKINAYKILTKKSPKMPQYEAKDITSEKLKWLWPKEGYSPPIPSIKVAVQHDKNEKVELYLNGVAVSLLNYDGQIRGQNKRNVISIYRGIDILAGDNILTAKILSLQGEVQDTLKRKVHLSTTPSDAKLLENKSSLIAEDKTSPVLAVRLVDDQGYPIRDDIQGTFTVEAPYTILSRKDKLTQNPISKIGGREKYIVYGDGITYIKLTPTTESGEVKLHFNLQNNDKVIRAWLKPKAREWLIVGFAEGTIGFNTLNNHVENTKDGTNLYRKGQIAFFAKGKIKGDYLLTLSYDSGKEKDLELFDSIDPDEYYTIYQDKSIQKHEAQSKKRLYLKIEKEKFYMLFGDIKTSLDINELSKYQKTLNGIKSEYKGKKYEYSAFISDTKNIFIKDEIQGDGTSGIYHLKNKNIIINSEMITIEVRDRFRDEKILDALVLKRYRDYSIDYDEGEIYFKEPIFSQDDLGNKRFIIVDYEIEGDGKSRYTYGGRGAVKFRNEQITIGSTYIKENNGKKQNHLVGIDSTIKISSKFQIKSEYAQTTSSIDKKDIKGKAFLVEAKYNNKLLKADAYIRQEKDAFGLGQQKESTKHHRKSGVDITLNYWQYLAIKFLAYEDKDLNSDYQKRSAEIIARFKQKYLKTHGGFRYSQTNNTKSTQIIIGASKNVYNNKIKLTIEHENALQNQTDEFPTRTRVSANYAINNYIDLFLANERSNGNLTKLNQSHLGIKSKFWKGNQVTGELLGENKNDSYKLFNKLGITQKWQINKNLSVNGGIEKQKSIKSDNNQNEDFTAYSTSISYKNRGYNYTNKIEYKDTKTEDKINIDLGVYKEIQSDLGVVFGIRSNSIRSMNNSKKLSSNLSFVYRPKSTWMVLNRFDFIHLTKSNDKMKKFINNLLINYKPIDDLELSLQYGLKYIQENIDANTFDTVIDLLGVDVIYNISQKYEIGLHTSLLHSYQNKQIDYSIGVHTAYNVTNNSWLALGYNMQGFDDSDFSSQNYRIQGPYIQLRVKLDQLSMSEFLNEI